MASRINRKTLIVLMTVLVVLGSGVLVARYLGVGADFLTQSGLEQTLQWQQKCFEMSGYQSKTADQNTQVAECGYNAPKKLLSWSGLRRGVLQLSTAKTTESNLIASVGGLEPGAKYRLSFWSQIKNRRCFSIKDLNYPDWLKKARTIGQDLPVWCGQYDVLIKNQLGETTSWQSVLPEQNNYLGDIKYADHGWFYNAYEFTALNQNNNLELAIKLFGFDGELSLDKMQLEKIESFLADDDLKIPVISEEMRIVSQSNKAFATDHGRFVFEEALAQAFGGANLQEPLAQLAFSQKALADLKIISQGEGYTLYGNEALEISLAADATMIFRLKKDLNLDLSGIKPAFYRAEYGSLYLRETGPLESAGGIFFSPIMSRGDLDFYRNHLAEIDAGQNAINFWEVPSSENFQAGDWHYNYQAKKGDAFILSVFPAKSFNLTAFCQKRSNLMPAVTAPKSDWWSQIKHKVNNLNNFANVLVLDHSIYKVTNHQFNPSSLENSLVETPLFDIQWPAEFNQNSEWLKNLSNIQSLGGQQLIRISPKYFRQADAAQLLRLIQQHLKKNNVGVYYNNLFTNDLMENIRLVRKTRATLGDKFYIQQLSPFWLKMPFLSTYADQIWVRNEELVNSRPIGYGDSGSAVFATAETSAKNELLDQSLDELGYQHQTNNFFAWPNYYQSRNSTTQETQDMSAYFSQLNQFCLNKTCPNSQCDIGESYLSCPQDCAPKNPSLTLTKQGGLVNLKSNNGVANYILSNQALFKLHYDFNENVAYDVSGSKIDADIGGKIFPSQRENEGRQTFYFNGEARLAGNYHERINSDNFSLFAVIKNESAADGVKTIFSQGNDYYFGIQADQVNGNKLVFGYQNEDKLPQTIVSENIITNDWHMVGFVYAKPNIKFYLDAKLIGSAEIGGLQSSDSNSFSIGSITVPLDNNLSEAKWYYKGYLDDLFLSLGPLNDEQVKSLYADGSGNSYLKTLVTDLAAKAVVSLGSKQYQTIE